MGLKAINVFLLIVLSTVVIQTALAKPQPRDSTAGHDESVVPLNNEFLQQKVETTKRSESYVTDMKIPGRVSCEFEEATEDTICQEHCLPKGYTYGICVSHTCSCI